MPRINVNDLNSQPSSGGKTTTTETVAPTPSPVTPPETAADQSLDDQIKQAGKSSMVRSFVAFPTNVHFSGEDPGESIFILVRAHVITNVGWILTVLFLLTLPLILLPALFAAGVIGGSSGVPIW